MNLKRLSREPWFGKKRSGWGLRPVSSQGWLVTLIFVVLLAGLMALSLINYQYVWIIEAIILVLFLIFIATALLTSDRPSQK